MITIIRRLVASTLLAMLGFGGITATSEAAPPAGVQWVTHHVGEDAPGRWKNLEFEYPTNVSGPGMAIGSAIESACRQKYDQLTEPEKFPACHETGMAKKGLYKAEDIPEAVTQAMVDPYAKEAKESSVKAMQTMMRAVTWAWTSTTFNPTVATVRDGGCAGDEARPLEGKLGSQCYRTAQPLVEIRRDLDPLIGVVTVLAVLFACGRIAVEQRADGMLALGRSIASTIVVGSMLAIVTQAAITITDGLTAGIMRRAPNEHDNGLQNAAALLGNPGADKLSFFILAVIAVLVVLAAAAQIMLMIFRMAVLPALIAWAPVAAASSSTRVGSQWLQKTLMTIVAFVIYKPVAAGTYVLGLRMLSFSASEEQLKGPEGPVYALVSVCAAITLLLICVIALPAAMRWLVPLTSPGMSSLFSGGALAAGAVTGAVALGSAGAAAAGVLGSSGGRGVASSGPSTTGTPMSGGPGSATTSASGASSTSGPDGAVSTPAPVRAGDTSGGSPAGASPAGASGSRRDGPSGTSGGVTGASGAGPAAAASAGPGTPAGAAASGDAVAGASAPGEPVPSGAGLGSGAPGPVGDAGRDGRDGRSGVDVPQGSGGAGRGVNLPPVAPIPPASGVFDDGEGSDDGVY